MLLLLPEYLAFDKLEGCVSVSVSKCWEKEPCRKLLVLVSDSTRQSSVGGQC